jgi:putative SOS response-associated peptidase YedK
MCGRFNITTPPEALRALFGYVEQPNFPPRYNIAPTQPVPIVTLIKGQRHFQLVRWGLVPSWAKEMPKSVLINARAETISEKPSFRGGIRHRRCLVPADGFYEWQARDDRTKQPFLIRRKDRQPFAMAGIWEDWLTADGSELDSCAVITTAANDTLSPIHQRMPVILDPTDWDRWLNTVDTSEKDARKLLKPAPNELMEAVPISDRVNKVSENDADLLKPVSQEEPKTAGVKPQAKRDNNQLDLL